MLKFAVARNTAFCDSISAGAGMADTDEAKSSDLPPRRSQFFSVKGFGPIVITMFLESMRVPIPDDISIRAAAFAQLRDRDSRKFSKSHIHLREKVSLAVDGSGPRIIHIK